MSLRPVLAALFALALLLAAPARAVESPDYDKEARITLDKDRYLRIFFWSQFWARFNENNPDTAVRGRPAVDTFDAGLRRTRMVFFGQITPRIRGLIHLGINNQGTFTGGISTSTGLKPQIFFHEAEGEYELVQNNVLWVGGGIHFWGGPQRFSGASTATILGLDLPLINFPTIDLADQFGRNMGVFAKGKLAERLDYRVSFNNSFATPTGTPAEGRADFSPTQRTFNVQGYVSWDFLEIESNVLPYHQGTYLGKKRIFNIGVGGYFSPNATASLTNGMLDSHDILLLSADTFLDIPIGPANGALTAYFVYSHFDYGPNYLRNVGALNPSSTLVAGTTGSINGPGNGVPILGTGNLYFIQAGYLLPDVLPGFRLQPYASLGAYDFERLADAVLLPDAGVNIMPSGHHFKFTANYRSRPIYENVPEGRPRVTQRKNEVTVQVQVLF